MLRAANLSSRDVTEQVKIYAEKYSIELDPTPLIPASYSNPLNRNLYTQQQISDDIEKTIKTISENNYDSIIYSALPDISYYICKYAKEYNLEVWMPIFAKRTRMLNNVVKIVL